MILPQSKEEPSTLQLPHIVVKDNAPSRTEHGQLASHTPDIDPPPYSNLNTNNQFGVSDSAVVPQAGGVLVLANATTLNTIRLEKHHGSITGKYYFVSFPCV